MLDYKKTQLYPNPSFPRGTSPFVDFQAIDGLTGVFIATQLDKGKVGTRPYRTLITYNKGGTWQLIQPPRYDSDGSMMECFLVSSTSTTASPFTLETINTSLLNELKSHLMV